MINEQDLAPALRLIVIDADNKEACYGKCSYKLYTDVATLVVMANGNFYLHNTAFIKSIRIQPVK